MADVLDRLTIELRHLWTAWWCRGHGAAVAMLLVVSSTFRDSRDVIFWAAVGFFVGHTATAFRRYLIERRVRARAIVVTHHLPHRPAPPNGCECGRGPVFAPLPITSLIGVNMLPIRPLMTGSNASKTTSDLQRRFDSR